MTIFRTLHRSILVLFAVVSVSIITLIHFSVSKMVAEQSRAHQQSISPAITLITEQLLQPLHVAQALAKAQALQALMAQNTLVEKDVFPYLEKLHNDFGMLFFVAHERSRKQYQSDGSQLDLIEGEVNWYFKYKNVDKQAVADIGKWEDTHFYIDIKMLDEKDAFLGYFGVGKNLRGFLDVFAQYKDIYGYDFIFVDNEQRITLSSDPELNASKAGFKSLSDLPWYQSLDQETTSLGSLNNVLIKVEGKDALIAEVKIDPFGWTLYLLTPLSARQTELSRDFVFSVISLLVVVFALFLVIYNLLYYFKRDLQNTKHLDPLTALPNRNKIALRYAELLERDRPLSLLLIDLDNFGALNETHGHRAGDRVLSQVAEQLNQALREDDIVGRWGGEEFVILLPDTLPEHALDVAQKLRERLQNMTAYTGTMSLQITVSIGITFTQQIRDLNELIDEADNALFGAKQAGRNQVKLHESANQRASDHAA